jgi:hypothetical protein
MSELAISREEFLGDRQGRTYVDVLHDPQGTLDEVLAFFSDEGRQRRMEESEKHHDRAPLAGVVRELESQPAIDHIFSGDPSGDTKRLRQAIGVVVRIIMERRGWKKTGKKGSLGVRTSKVPGMSSHNSGGLVLWFVRAERYELAEGMPFRSVIERRKDLCANLPTGRFASAISRLGPLG